ncbi:MAG: major facilitator superfamily 1 [Bryobacterales bacterium]|nr:major facilitator superfamily 1 [Bryobacterales bacterium]
MTPTRRPETSAPAAQASVPSTYAWYAAVVLMLCYTLSYIDRQILSLLVPFIKADLKINDTLVGLLQGFSFALFYAIMGLPLGRVADSANRRNLISISIAFWSIFTAGCALARSYTTLFLARVGVGIGEAGLNPASFSILSDLFPKERLGAALSVFYIGNLLGSSLALIVGGTAVQAVTRQPEITLPVLGTIASWRMTFLILGLPGLFFALLVFTLKEPIRKNLARTSTGATRLTIAETFTEIRSRWQSVLGISVGFVFQAACNYGFTAWVPTYFLRAHGWTIGQTGRALGFLILPFGCLGLYLGGWLSERWQKRGMVDAPLLVGIPCAIGILLFLVPAMLMPSAGWSLALIGPGLFFLVLPMGTAGAALQLIFPNQVRAQVSALYLFILNLGGLTLGPLMPGVFADYLFKDPKMIGAALSLTMAISGVLMLIVVSVTRRPYRKHFLEMNS